MHLHWNTFWFISKCRIFPGAFTRKSYIPPAGGVQRHLRRYDSTSKCHRSIIHFHILRVATIYDNCQLCELRWRITCGNVCTYNYLFIWYLHEQWWGGGGVFIALLIIGTKCIKKRKKIQETSTLIRQDCRWNDIHLIFQWSNVKVRKLVRVDWSSYWPYLTGWTSKS